MAAQPAGVLPRVPSPGPRLTPTALAGSCTAVQRRDTGCWALAALGALGCLGCRIDFQQRVPGDGATRADAAATIDAGRDADPSGPDGPGRPDAAVDAGFTCPGTYSFVVGPRRFVLKGSDEWRNGEVDCESDGATTHLAVIDSAAELAALQALTLGAVVWIGLSDRITEGVPLAVTGASPTFLPWLDADAANRDCVTAEAAGFRRADCLSGRPRICACDGQAPDPASY